MSRFVIVMVMLTVLAGCSSKIEDLKSPCVGAEGSPCDRRPVNDWWHEAG